MILPWEQRFALQHLGEDAPGTPDVHLHVVLLPREHDLRRTVVPSRDITRHLRVLDPSQAKIADLQVTILVDQDVARLEITMDNSSGVDVFETALRHTLAQLRASRGAMTNQNLVEEVLDELLL